MTSAAIATGTEGSQTLFPIVSVDDHIMVAPTLFQDRLPASAREGAPSMHRELRPSIRSAGTQVWGDVWRYEDVEVPIISGHAGAGKPPDEFDMEPMTYDDIRPGCYDLAPRLADMDLDGVEASVCFPNLFVRFCGQRFAQARDKDVALLCVRAYNDWIVEDWRDASEGRIIPSIIVPLWDVDLAIKELERNASRGVTAVCFSEIPAYLGLPSMYSGQWEPFFAACAAAEIVINMHVGSSSVVATTSADAPQVILVANHFGATSLSLSDWLSCGVFERHPTLKIAYTEGQAGWVPFLMSRLDKFWHTGSAVAKYDLPKPPSAYLRDHVYFCVFDDPAVLRYLDIVSEDNLCFETDYPHPDGSWPSSREAAWRQTSGLTPEQRVKILRDNAARLYRIERVLNTTVDLGLVAPIVGS